MKKRHKKIKRALVCGAGGFIGSHLVKRLKKEGFWVRGVDIKYPEYSKTAADEFFLGDLRDIHTVEKVINLPFDEVYQLAADMGGAGYVFTGENDADILANSTLINILVLKQAQKNGVRKIFFSSSACIYPRENQINSQAPDCSEESAYPANPDSDYGWEKLYSERLFLAFGRNYHMKVKIARFHNVFGPEGTWDGGKEKAPAAICRKIAQAKNNGTIEIWGDGMQTRSFLYIDECLDGIRRLMDTRSFSGPVNIGSTEMVSINSLVDMVAAVARKKIKVKHISGPLGVRGRNSDNSLIKKKLHWAPSQPLQKGIAKTYTWIASQVEQNKR